MNIYRHAFTLTCPNNGQTIAYRLTITTIHVLMVEDITAACVEAQQLGKPYHENVADMLHAKFGGQQCMVAFHHGVQIETHRGF